MYVQSELQSYNVLLSLSQFVLEPEQQSAVKSKNPPVHSEAVLPHADSDASAAPGAVSLQEPPLHPLLRLQPVVEAWTELRYQHMRALHIWSLCLSEDAIVTLVSSVCEGGRESVCVCVCEGEGVCV